VSSGEVTRYSPIVKDRPCMELDKEGKFVSYRDYVSAVFAERKKAELVWDALYDAIHDLNSYASDVDTDKYEKVLKLYMEDK